MAQPVHSSRAPAPGAPHPGEAAQSPLKSNLAGDPEMRELVAFFLDDLGARVLRLTDALTSGDAASLQQMAHQLKGAGGGYGYPDITTAAGAVEDHLRGGETDVTALTNKVRDLVSLCERAMAGR